MRETLLALQASQLISVAEMEAAVEAEQAGQQSTISIGCENEITESSVQDAAFIYHLLQLAHNDRKVLQGILATEVRQYNFTTADDEVVELVSPGSAHPIALITALNGLSRVGLLPRETTGLVPSHISICMDDASAQQANRQELITILRAVELGGHHVTAERLRYPVQYGQQIGTICLDAGWNVRGLAGVKMYPADEKYQSKHRVELRTPQLKSIRQFGSALIAVYYITSGMFSQKSTVAYALSTSFHNWVKEYFATYGLPEITPDLEHDPQNPVLLGEYIEPYAQRLENGNDTLLAMQIQHVITAISEEMGMHNLALPASIT